jgi:hypothetical protein
MIVKSISLLRVRNVLCVIKNVLAKDNVDETVHLLYVTTRKASSEMGNKKTTGKE